MCIFGPIFSPFLSFRLLAHLDGEDVVAAAVHDGRDGRGGMLRDVERRVLVGDGLLPALVEGGAPDGVVLDLVVRQRLEIARDFPAAEHGVANHLRGGVWEAGMNGWIETG